MTIPTDSLKRHVAGATVSHAGPFTTIDVPRLAEPLSREFCKKWVIPTFYQPYLDFGPSKFVEAFHPIASEVTSALLTSMLSDFNWRSRIAASYFAAILMDRSVEEHIGRLLLRSDACYAGKGYCLALVRFNTPNSVEYLSQYLTYYLSRPDLYFDQGDAFGALAYLDKINGTTHLGSFSEQWDVYAQSLSARESQKQIDHFEEKYARLLQIITEMGRP